MRIEIGSKKGVAIHEGMIGLFFEDINYSADGGLYAEMLENRSFEFLKAAGEYKDYYLEYDGSYGWKAFPREKAVKTSCVMGSPLSEENPHYMRLTAMEAGGGISNKAYEGMYLEKGMEYTVTFWARRVKYEGDFVVGAVRDGRWYAKAVAAPSIPANGEAVLPEFVTEDKGESYNYFRKYQVTMTAQEDVEKALFVLCLSEPGTVELDFVSVMPKSAVAGIFRRDLFEKLRDLKPGFIRFPGGCIVEGNTLDNRYRFKESLKPVWARRNNWNRWAVHGNNEENQFVSEYAHYNQTLGLGYYEYFLLCEMIGANPLPVLNVGLACQYMSTELVAVDSPEFQQFVQDALDLIEFANGDVNTAWGAVRKEMGHEAPFGLTMLGIGNEQWETDKTEFFKRYTIFEKAIHEYDPSIKLIGSAGPDITSEKYEKAWKFYHENEDKENFVYGVDEHYYVPPKWLFEHVDFYDNYSRKVKVFSGEYAAHPVNGFNRPDANTLEGALAEAAFLTGVERNADVVVLASYAPLFARAGYAQWSPDMIWFDGKTSYGTPSYYVQQMYARNMGSVTIDTEGKEKEAAKEKIYYSLSYAEETKEIIVKAVNANTEPVSVSMAFSGQWQCEDKVHITLLTGENGDVWNSLECPQKAAPAASCQNIAEELVLPGMSFAVVRIGAE